jgi:hypothetical protein
VLGVSSTGLKRLSIGRSASQPAPKRVRSVSGSPSMRARLHMSGVEPAVSDLVGEQVWKLMPRLPIGTLVKGHQFEIVHDDDPHSGALAI